MSDWQQSLAEEANRFIWFVSKRVKSQELAEDLFQDAFVKALQSDAGPSDEEKAHAWFYRILRNVIIDSYRANAADQRKLSSWERDADIFLADKEIKKLCCDYENFFVDKLKPEHAEILRALDLGDTTIAAYAQDHGISEGNVRVKRHRARAALKKAILDVCRCLVDPDGNCGCPD